MFACHVRALKQIQKTHFDKDIWIMMYFAQAKFSTTINIFQLQLFKFTFKHTIDKSVYIIWCIYLLHIPYLLAILKQGHKMSRKEPSEKQCQV